MSEDPLVMRAKQATAALAKSISTDWKPEMVVHEVSTDRIFGMINPSGGFAPEDLHNEVLTILSAIGSLKDYINEYCEIKGVPKSGDKVLAANRDAALVHDLWNTDKHQVLRNKPKSGIKPELREIQKWMSMTATESDGATFVSMNLESGPLNVQGSVTFLTDAMIFDEDGIFVANFRTTCDGAIEAWLAEIKRLGIDVSARR